MFQVDLKFIITKGFSVLIFFFFNLSSLFALPEDNKQPLLVRADSADLNQSEHVGIYQGHVKIDQGSTHIRSDKTVTIADAHNKLVLATFEGNADKLVHYWTKQSAEKPILHAYADKICYCPQQFQVVLIGHARVVQESNQINAQTICYNTQTQRVTTPFHGEQTKIIVTSVSASSRDPQL